MIKTPRAIQAVLFDWAGTTIDYGSREPALVFQEIFRRQEVAITLDEARGPMGLAKRDHFRALLEMPRIAAAWEKVHGHRPNTTDIDSLFAAFLPLQKETLAGHCDVIPGVLETVAECRRRGLKIGSTTGYYRELMEVVLPAAKDAGFEPDVTVTPDDAAAGRPAPWMNLRAAELLGVYPLCAVVAVDDTAVGIEAARHAGAWAVAVSKTGNALGLSQVEVESLPAAELQPRLQKIADEFLAAGAHYVINGVGDLIPIIDAINRRLSQGERP